MRTANEYIPFSSLNTKNLLPEMVRLSQAPGLEKKDAETVRNIMAELDTSDKALRADMLRRLKEIYVKKYFLVKSKKGDRGVRIVGANAPP